MYSLDIVTRSYRHDLPFVHQAWIEQGRIAMVRHLASSWITEIVTGDAVSHEYDYLLLLCVGLHGHTMPLQPWVTLAPTMKMSDKREGETLAGRSNQRNHSLALVYEY